MVLNYFDGSTFNDLKEAMENIVLFVPDYYIYCNLDDYTMEEKKELIDYCGGKYIRKIKYSENDIGVYEFTYCKYSVKKMEESDEKFLEIALIPTYFSDDRIVEMIGDFQGNLYEQTFVDKNINDLSWETISCTENNYPDDFSRLISFEGNFRKIKKDELYIEHHGLNYLILEEECDDNGNPYIGTSFSKKQLEDSGISWDKIEKDNFMGKFIRHAVHAIGTYIKETYVIDSVENDILYCIDKEHTPIFTRNLPQIASYENGECRYCWRTYDFEYIPYSLDESL